MISLLFTLLVVYLANKRSEIVQNLIQGPQGFGKPQKAREIFSGKEIFHAYFFAPSLLVHMLNDFIGPLKIVGRYV